MTNQPIIQPESVKSLLITMRFNETPISEGTAFVVSCEKGPLLITNRHNVTGRRQDNGKCLSKTGAIPNNIEITHNRKNKLGQWLVKNERLLDDEEKELWFEHPKLGAKADFVALPLHNVSDVELYEYNLLEPDLGILVGPSDRLSVIGFPFGIQAGGSLAVWATGFMASEPDINYEDLPVFLIDCRARQGQSGSPVVFHRSAEGVRMKNGGVNFFQGTISRLLGIYSGRINSESDLGKVWKAEAIGELVEHYCSS